MVYTTFDEELAGEGLRVGTYALLVAPMPQSLSSTGIRASVYRRKETRAHFRNDNHGGPMPHTARHQSPGISPAHPGADAGNDLLR